MNENRRYLGIQRTARLVRDLLSGRSHDRESAAKLLEIGPENAYRQLDALEESVPAFCWDETKRRKTLYFDRTRLLDQPGMPAAIAACFGRSLAPLFAGTEQQDGMQKAFDYVLGQTQRRKLFRDIDRKFFFVLRGGETALPRNPTVFALLVTAILDCREVVVRYTHFGGAEDERLTLRPLSMCIYNQWLYLLAQHENSKPRPFRLSRIHEVSAEPGAEFSYPPHAQYSPSTLFRDSFGIFTGGYPTEEIELVFAANWAAHVDSHKWHESQEVVSLDSGEVLVRLTVRLCPEVRSWILGLGNAATVLKPQSLRDEIGAALRETLANYDG